MIHRENVTHARLPEEQQRILDKCYHPSGMFEEFEWGEIEQSIPSRFEKIVSSYGDRLAVKTETQALTYGELDRRANRIAQRILALLGDKQEPVALIMKKSPQMIASILGILKAGKAYVPLEPAYFGPRVAQIVDDSETRIIVAHRATLPFITRLKLDRYTVVNVDDLTSKDNAEPPCVTIGPDHLAWILYTSGTTGEPKGVYQNHRNLLYSTMARTNKYHVCPHDRYALPQPLSFSGSLNNLFPTLVSGASLFPIDVASLGANGLAAFLLKQRITLASFVPQVFRLLADAMDGVTDMPHLRLVGMGADRILRQDVELFQRSFAYGCKLRCSLSATESKEITEYFYEKDSALPEQTVPVGYAYPGTEVMVLDENGQRLDNDEVGEIAVKGRYLALGYWRRPELTAERFLPDPEGGEERTYLTGDLGLMKPDGCLYHMGRKDFQVKVRGHRVELGEVEATLAAVPGVKESAVSITADKSGENRIVGYYVSAKHISTNVNHLRRFLESKLPEYMVPSAFVEMDALPQTPSGKIDRNALPEPSSRRPHLDAEYLAPRTPVEEFLAKVWGEVLGIDQVGVHDDFRDLGGNSLMAGQVISRMLQEFQIELPMRSLMDAPTVADMALLITENRARKASPEDLENMLQELENMQD
jgi:amino acid adenylation domain-containing protein